jgi:hypothetical protein
MYMMNMYLDACSPSLDDKWSGRLAESYVGVDVILQCGTGFIAYSLAMYVLVLCPSNVGGQALGNTYMWAQPDA